MILDGVVDADQYVSPIWMDSIRHADTIFDSLPKYCHQAKEACALYRPEDKIADIEARLLGALNDIRENPITIIDSVTKTPVIITYSDIRAIIFTALYSPISDFLSVAMIVDLIEKGNVESIAHMFSLTFGNELRSICATPLPEWRYPNEAGSSNYVFRQKISSEDSCIHNLCSLTFS